MRILACRSSMLIFAVVLLVLFAVRQYIQRRRES
jgi:cell division protein FtsX